MHIIWTYFFNEKSWLGAPASVSYFPKFYLPVLIIVAQYLGTVTTPDKTPNFETINNAVESVSALGSKDIPGTVTVSAKGSSFVPQGAGAKVSMFLIVR